MAANPEPWNYVPKNPNWLPTLNHRLMACYLCTTYMANASNTTFTINHTIKLKRRNVVSDRNVQYLLSCKGDRSITQGCKMPESLLLAGLSKQQAQLPSKLLLEVVWLLSQVCDCMRAVHPAGLSRTAPLSQLQQHHEPAQMQGIRQAALHDLRRFQRP